jgi:glycine betaine/proline transport system substrate-binding protein
MKTTRHPYLAYGLAAVLAAGGSVVAPGMHAAAGADKPGAGITVRPVQMPDADSQFQIQVANIGLAELGYGIARTQLLQGGLYFTAIASGDGDFGAETWWPGYKYLFDAAGGEAKATLLGTIVPDGRQGYFIDKATAEKYGITDISQLADPKLAALFSEDGRGIADLSGCEAGWICEKVVDHQIQAYGLSKTVRQIKGDNAVLNANVLARHKAALPILYFANEPAWLNQVLQRGRDVVQLTVPFTSLPAGTFTGTPQTVAADGKNYGWLSINVRTEANNAFLAKNPAARRFLERVSIPPADVNAENLLIHNGEKSDADIRRHAEQWIAKNRALFDRWLADAQKAAVADLGK